MPLIAFISLENTIILSMDNLCMLVFLIKKKGSQSKINSLRMLVNKNGVKGSDFEHTVAMSFFPN